jgi:hypothetical protein
MYYTIIFSDFFHSTENTLPKLLIMWEIRDEHLNMVIQTVNERKS